LPIDGTHLGGTIERHVEDTASIDAIVDELTTQGSVVLRRVFERERIAQAWAIIDEIRQGGCDDCLNTDVLGPSWLDEVVLEPTRTIVDAAFGAYPYSPPGTGGIRTIDVRAPRPEPNAPHGPHLDAFSIIPAAFWVQLWIPLEPCGVDAPGLAAVRAPFSEIRDFVGFDPGSPIPDPDGGPEHMHRFRPEMKRLYKFGDADEWAELDAHFAGRIAAPRYEPGDALLLTNWTLHWTTADLSMPRQTRSSVEVRFPSNASLDDVLAARGITL
jgi:hypothetical protein